MNEEHNLDVFDEKRAVKNKPKAPGFRILFLVCLAAGILFVLTKVAANQQQKLPSEGPISSKVALAPKATTSTESHTEDSPTGRLLFEDTFDKGDLNRWEPTDVSAWAMVVDGTRHVYALNKVSDYKPPVRAPLSYSLVRDVTAGAFVMTVRLKSLGPEGDHQDLCLFFGYQDPTHFYYVHLGRKADPHANSIFIVNATDRVSIASKQTDGTPWDDQYHKVKVVRKLNPPAIEVYWDNQQEPVMTANDGTFTLGRIGVGSFDNLGVFDEIQLFSLE